MEEGELFELCCTLWNVLNMVYCTAVSCCHKVTGMRAPWALCSLCGSHTDEGYFCEAHPSAVVVALRSQELWWCAFIALPSAQLKGVGLEAPSHHKDHGASFIARLCAGEITWWMRCYHLCCISINVAHPILCLSASIMGLFMEHGQVLKDGHLRGETGRLHHTKT
eukprot:6808426-Ditylum_brightwellii.AAC.1